MIHVHSGNTKKNHAILMKGALVFANDAVHLLQYLTKMIEYRENGYLNGRQYALMRILYILFYDIIETK